MQFDGIVQKINPSKPKPRITLFQNQEGWQDAAGRCSKAYRCYDSQDWIVRFQKEANGLHPVSTGFPVARRCVREVDIRVHDYRAAERTMIRQRIEI